MDKLKLQMWFFRHNKRKLPRPKRDCYFCFYFTLKEFTEEGIKRCAENWLDAENCPNWRPLNVSIIKKKREKRIIWVENIK